jgi:hypothetical protein
MSATRIQDLCISVDSYDDAGKKKYRRITIGSIWKNSDGGIYFTAKTLALAPTLALLAVKTSKNAGDNIIGSIFDVDKKTSNPPPEDEDGQPY